MQPPTDTKRDRQICNPIKTLAQRMLKTDEKFIFDYICLQHFDAVGWKAGKASGL